jgi:hypothetical protein
LRRPPATVTAPRPRAEPQSYDQQWSDGQWRGQQYAPQQYYAPQQPAARRPPADPYGRPYGQP